MTIKVGDKIPSVTLRHMTAEGPKDISTDELFSGKKVVLFAVPGAFTPTCSAKHLPGFIEKSGALKGKGIDKVACISVNDAFVMDAWGKAQNAGDKVEMIADASRNGLGKRSQRYAMVVDKGVVTKLYVEKPGAFEVSSAEHVLGDL